MSARALAGAEWRAVQSASALRLRDHFEVARELAQFEREEAFIALVNALGGMSRTALIHGHPVQVNGAGVPWREKRMAEGKA